MAKRKKGGGDAGGIATFNGLRPGEWGGEQLGSLLRTTVAEHAVIDAYEMIECAMAINSVGGC